MISRSQIWYSDVPAIMHITHAAQEQGTAIADVIFGDYNPAGRLVQTWPKSLDQLPRMMDYDITKGRTYMYFKDEPLYAFGYGLSYSTFEYSNLKINRDKMSKKGSINVTSDIKNTGRSEGDEVVQLYVLIPESKVIRPIKALKGFQRISLKAGESKTVSFALKAQSLECWNDNTPGWEVESGPVIILFGSLVLALTLTLFQSSFGKASDFGRHSRLRPTKSEVNVSGTDKSCNLLIEISGIRSK